MKRDILRRFSYIESCLYWGGGITAVQLGQTFDIARQNAQATIERYRQLYPESMVYNPSSKRHEASEIFKPQHISQEARHYLNYLRGNSLCNHFWEDEEWGHLEVEDVEAVYRPYLDKTILRLVVSAIRNKQSLQIYYHSKALGHEHLTIAPNHLAYADRRYHLRAYCYDKNRFIDLVLSRILEAEPTFEGWVSSAEDEAWNEYIELHFTPNPALPDALKQTLLLDFRLRDDIYSLRVRKALQIYIERQMTQPDWQHYIPLWQKA